MSMRKYLRIGLIVLLPFFISGCFNILHYVDVGKDGKVQVRWRMSVSSALAEMGEMQNAGEGGEQDLGADLDEAKKRIQENMKGLAEKLEIKNFQNEQTQGLDLSMTLKSVAALKDAALPEDEMPIIPIFDAKKKQLVFRFTPESTEQLKGGEEEPPAPDEDESEESMSSEDEDSAAEEEESEESMGPGPGDQDPMGGLEQLGEKLGQLFSSAASYDIYVGSGFDVKEAFARTAAGKRVQSIEVIRLGEVSMIRFPLLGMISEDEASDGFDIVVQLK